MAETTNVAWARPAFGPPPAQPRDGDKKQARQRINVLVRTGRLAHPKTLACVDCGHVHGPGERRHEYDHYLGYAAKHHYDVQPVCTRCHAKRDSARAQATHCIKGHEFTRDNTYIAKNGTRHCRACSRDRDIKRGPRGSDYWRKVNERRKQRHG